MRPIFGELVLAISCGQCLVASQTQAQQERRALVELQVVDATRNDPAKAWSTEALALAWCRSRHVVFFADDQGRLVRWDLPQLAEINGQTKPQTRVLTAVDGSLLRTLQATNDGKFVLAGHHPRPIPGFYSGPPLPAYVPAFFDVWDVEAGQIVQSFKGKDGRSYSDATLSADGKTLVAVAFSVGTKEDKKSAKLQVEFWDVAGGKLERSLPDLQGPVAISPDGKTLAANKWENGISTYVLLDAATGVVRATLEIPKPTIVDNKPLAWAPAEFRFAPDGKHLAGMQRQKRDWLVWNMQGKIVLGADRQRLIQSFCFFPNGTWFARSDIRKVMASSADGKVIGTSEDGCVRFWNAPKHTPAPAVLPVEP